MDTAPSDQWLTTLAETLGGLLEAAGQTLATAESCTGGWVAKAVTGIAGSSAWFDRGFVTYSNAAKQDMLGVPAEIIDRHGAVSAEVVAAMTAGALTNSAADWAVAISGVAGPDGGTDEKPVGTVWFAWQTAGQDAETQCEHLAGDREAVRRSACALAMQGLIDRLR